MREPSEIAAAKLSLAIADLQDELSKLWDDTVGRWIGPSKLRGRAARRRELAYQAFQRWPVSLGGSIPDDLYEAND